MNYKTNKVTTNEEAKNLGLFFASKNGFLNEGSEFEFSKAEIELMKNEPISSINDKTHHFWFVMDEEKNILGGIGVKENAIKTNGHYLDWFVVHKDYRRTGLGKDLIDSVENYLKSIKARYLTIDTGDTDRYKAARDFYEKNGYKQVGYIPRYYNEKEGRVDYVKYFQKLN